MKNKIGPNEIGPDLFFAQNPQRLKEKTQSQVRHKINKFSLLTICSEFKTIFFKSYFEE